MNEIAKRNDSYVARYEVTDPFVSFSNEGAPGIIGKLLTCKKGVYGIGSDESPPPAGARYLFLVETLSRGWLKWLSGVIVAADMGLVAENFLVKHRNALGDLDEEAWEQNPDGTRRDPWSRAYRAVLVEVSPPHGELTFSGSSYGTEVALKELSGNYAAGRSQHPDCYPVVELGTAPWMSKRYGKQIRPDFPIVGWASLADVKAGRKSPAALARPKPKAKAKAEPTETLGEALDDAIPNWGK